MIQQSPQFMFLIYVAVFIGALLAFDGLRQLLSRSENQSEARNRRMRMKRKGISEEQILELMREPEESRQHRTITGRLRRIMRQAGVPARARVLILVMAVLGGGLFVLISRYLEPALAAPAAAVLATFLPIAVLDLMRTDRQNKLTAQLPDALELMARGLRVGHPISVTVESVASNMPDPIGSEFGIIQDQISFGDDVTTAFHEFGERIGTEDARYLSVSVGIQHGTGGNLSRVLEVLAKVIRDRFLMRKKIKAISSEGRLSAIILTFLPVAIFLSIHMTTPSFYGEVQNDPLFRYFAAAIISLVLFQGFILHRLVKFKF